MKLADSRSILISKFTISFVVLVITIDLEELWSTAQYSKSMPLSGTPSITLVSGMLVILFVLVIIIFKHFN